SPSILLPAAAALSPSPPSPPPPQPNASTAPLRLGPLSLPSSSPSPPPPHLPVAAGPPAAPPPQPAPRDPDSTRVCSSEWELGRRHPCSKGQARGTAGLGSRRRSPWRRCRATRLAQRCAAVARARRWAGAQPDAGEARRGFLPPCHPPRRRALLVACDVGAGGRLAPTSAASNRRGPRLAQLSGWRC
ncbi:unnamed protein product, partial [Urochloa humidicola]